MDTYTAAGSQEDGAGDSVVLAAVAAGDPDALAVLWHRHAATVIRFCIRRCETADDVADAVAETFLVAWRAAGRYRPETPTAAPWLLGIARRTVARQHRTVAGSRRLAQRLARRADGWPRFADEEYAAVDAAVDAAQQAPAIKAALRALPARERQVLELVAYDELDPTEAARVLGVSPNAARLRLARARRRLRERFPDVSAELVGPVRRDARPAAPAAALPPPDDRQGDASRAQ